jgi:hypothetical protein|tara:strand:+ start:687 stop:1040 length:354 start_codon:yes stop_codon:yes gene_type:complete
MKNLVIHSTNGKEPDLMSYEDMGYSYIINKDGYISKLSPPDDIRFPLDTLSGKSIHIAYVGKDDDCDWTWEQHDSMEVFVKYHYLTNPNIKVYQYNINIKPWLKDLGIKEKNIKNAS